MTIVADDRAPKEGLQPLTLFGERIQVPIEGSEASRRAFRPYYVTRDDTLLTIPGLARCGRVLDMGTGTGILPILWASKFPGIGRIVGVERAPAAVELAKANVAAAGLQDRIEIVAGDLFDALGEPRGEDDRFDAIVFNGPHAYEEDPERKAEFGEDWYYSLYDPGLELATRFFADAGRWLKDDGFIVYTYSDYGRLDELFRLIANEGFVAGLLSTVEFRNERDVKDYWSRRRLPPDDPREPDQEYIPLWYNLIVWPQAAPPNIHELAHGYSASILSIANRYLSFRPEEEAVDADFRMEKLYQEFRSKVTTVIEGLCLQVGNLLGDQDWIVSGFSLPDWGGMALDWKLFYSIADPEDRSRQSWFDSALKKFVGILGSDLSDRAQLAIEWMSDPSNKRHLIESHRRGAFYRRDELCDRNKVIYHLNNRHFEVDEPLLPLAESRVEELKTRLRNALDRYEPEMLNGLFPDREGVAPAAHESEFKVVVNLWWNFLAVFLGKGTQYVRMKDLNYGPQPKRALVYFFTSLDPLEDVEAARFLDALEHAINIANAALYSMISLDLRQRHARQSAVASIMSRNMSHNIGSHVTPRATVTAILRRLDELAA